MPLRLPREVGPKMATTAQRFALYEILRDSPDFFRIKDMTKLEASRHIESHSKNWRRYPVTRHQLVFLSSRGLWREGLNRGAASDLIAAAKERERVDPEYHTRLKRHLMAPYLYSEEYVRGGPDVKPAPPADVGATPGDAVAQ